MNFAIILAGTYAASGWFLDSVRQWRQEYMVPKEARALRFYIATHAHIFFVCTHFLCLIIPCNYS